MTSRPGERIRYPSLREKPPAYRAWLLFTACSGIAAALLTARLRPDLWIPGPDQVLPLLLLLGLIVIGEVYHVDINVTHYGWYVVSPTFNLVAPALVLFTPAALAGAASAAVMLASVYRKTRRMHLAVANAIDIQQFVLARLLAELVPPSPDAPASILRAAACYAALRGLSVCNVAVLRTLGGYERFREALHRVSGVWIPADAALSILLSALLIDAARADRAYLALAPFLSIPYSAVYFLAGTSQRRIRAGRLCPLTGLPTHASLWEALRARMRAAYPTALLMIDIDRFKQLNDTRGHLEGDRVLREVARVIREEISASDMASRYGGEEFAVLLAAGDPGSAFAAAERIRRGVQRRCGVTVSVGGAVAAPGAPPEELVEAADAALYRSKREGRNRVTVLDGAARARTAPAAPEAGARREEAR